MNEPGAIRVVFDCPRCSQKVPVMLTKANLEQVATHGIVEVTHVFCNYKGPVSLGGTRRGEIVSLLAMHFGHP